MIIFILLYGNMSGENGKLDNISYTAIDSHEAELNKALEGIQAEGESLKQAIENMDEDRLIQVIEKNFKNGDKRKSYTEIKNSPAYAFITQAAIDMLGKYDSKLDIKLKANRGIDMDYGNGTKALVRRVEACLGIAVDKGQAGPDFFDAVVKCLQGQVFYDVKKAEQVTTSTPTPQRRPNGRVNSHEAPAPLPHSGERKINAFKNTLQTKLDSKEILGSYGFREEFNTGDHETPKTHAIRDSINKAYDNWNNTKGTIHIAFWGGTDKMSASANYKLSDYQNKKNAIITMLSDPDYSNMPNRSTLITYITDPSRNFFDATSPKFTSKYLVGCRNLEAIKVALEEYKTKFKGANIAPALEFDYLGDMDQAGDKVSQQQRFVEGVAYIDKKAGKIEVGGGNIDWIPLKMNEELDVMKREHPDLIRNEERDLGEALKADLNTHLVTIKTWNATVDQCDCGPIGNTCTYDWETGEVRVHYGNVKKLLPFKLPTLTCDSNGVPVENGSGSHKNQQIVKCFARLGNLMNKVKYEAIFNQKHKGVPIEWDIGFNPNSFEDSGRTLQVRDGTLHDTALIHPSTVDELDRWFSSYGMNIKQNGKQIAGLLNGIKENVGMITDAQLQQELDTNEYNDYFPYK